jgi:5-methyltetrahydrofolate--homocysteine methyltransferase
MQTVLKGVSKEVVIGAELPTVIIGERINPTGRKVFSAELQSGDLSRISRDALAQVEAGAAVLDVNVGAAGVDEIHLLPEAVQIVQDTVDVPISIDSPNPEALAAALQVCQGRPLVNSVTGEAKRLAQVLPVVAQYGAAVIGLCIDDDGIPETPEKRLAVAERIMKAAQDVGIAVEDILFDPVAMTVGANHLAAQVTITTAALIRQKLGANLTVGASNASHGMPDRQLLNTVFLTGFIQAGVNAPICNPATNALAVRAVDLMLGRDEWGMQYIQTYRKVQAAQTSEESR